MLVWQAPISAQENHGMGGKLCLCPGGLGSQLIYISRALRGSAEIWHLDISLLGRAWSLYGTLLGALT